MQWNAGRNSSCPARTVFVTRTLLVVVLTISYFMVAAPRSAVAGSGPENVFLVYNVYDHSSLTIANHYQHLRGIPANNLFGIDWQGPNDRIKIDLFREQLLRTILTEIDKRKLSQQIDCVVYSSGFPYAIDFTTDIPGKAPQFSVGSLTSLTFYYQSVLAKKLDYISPTANRYANTGLSVASTQAFRGTAQWADSGRQLARGERGGSRYLLSAMLGYTAGRGNTTEEVIDYLTLAATADGSFPTGEIYFMENADVRTRTRRSQFEPVVAALQREGVTATIAAGGLPQKSSRVAGVMAGLANFSWPASGSQLVPGAFCDNLTSFGGILRKGAGQTPLSEFLRYGAAGTCGTVIEPYALAAKFPHAVVHLHYVRGLSLAEAFYRSVRSPYQQLLVGDPLCQPWAAAPPLRVAIECDEDHGGSVGGAIVFQPSSSAQELHFELYVDGRLTGRCTNDQKMRIDSNILPDGYHDVRLVAVAQSNIATRSSKRIPLVINNKGNELVAEVAEGASTASSVVFEVAATNADGVQAWCGRRLVGVLDQPAGNLVVSRDSLGSGPASVQLVAVSKTTKAAVSFSRPIEVRQALTADLHQGPPTSNKLR